MTAYEVGGNGFGVVLGRGWEGDPLASRRMTACGWVALGRRQWLKSRSPASRRMTNGRRQMDRGDLFGPLGCGLVFVSAVWCLAFTFVASSFDVVVRGEDVGLLLCYELVEG